MIRNGAIGVHNALQGQVVALADVIIVKVVGRGDFHATRPKTGVNIVICDHWNDAVAQRQGNRLANQVLVPRIIWVHGHRRITEHCLGPGGCNFDKGGRHICHGIANMPKKTVFFFRDDLKIRN